MKRERIVYLDYLRVLAIVSVIFLHSAAQNWFKLDCRSFDWNVLNFYDSIIRYCVPVFVMISGALLLSREISLKALYTKYIFRLVIAFIVWSVVYLPFKQAINPITISSVADVLVYSLIGSEMHMWFIPMIIGVYICIPVLKQITQNRQGMKYFLVVSFIFAFLLPEVDNILSDFVGGSIASLYKAIVMKLYDQLELSMFGMYLFYFVLGYYLKDIELKKKQRTMIYIAGIFGVVLVYALTTGVSLLNGKPTDTYLNNQNLGAVLMSIAVFTWFKHHSFRHEKLNVMVGRLSKLSFGAYWVHMIIRDGLNELGFNSLSMPVIISVPILALVIAVISFAISYIISKIPILNKYII